VLRVRQGSHWSAGELAFLPPKTQRSRRTIPMSRLCVEALTAHRDAQRAERRASLHLWLAESLVFVGR
jgi:integrase